ncbi:MAG: alkaline phosphatase family protein, partial [Planctomycetales bacterium]
MNTILAGDGEHSHQDPFMPTTEETRPTSASKRILVIGLDGADYDVLTPIAESGKTPNLAALMQSSALAELNSTEPCITPAAWTSFLTGQDPERHGVLDYRYYDHHQRKLMMNHGGRIAGPTLFDAV